MVRSDTATFVLENRCALARTVGSNPTPSATEPKGTGIETFSIDMERTTTADGLAFARCPD